MLNALTRKYNITISIVDFNRFILLNQGIVIGPFITSKARTFIKHKESYDPLIVQCITFLKTKENE